LTWVTTYQDEPDFDVGQAVDQADPATVPETVTMLLGPSFALMVPRVEALVRKFTLAQAGTNPVAGAGAPPEATVAAVV